MSTSKLPERASLEYLKRLAKDRLQELRQADPRAKLATALLAVARDHGKQYVAIASGANILVFGLME